MNTSPSFRASQLTPPAARPLGQVSVEYVLASAAIAFALGVGMADDQSVLRQLLEAFQLGYQRIAFAISLPT